MVLRFKILVTGDRNWNSRKVIKDALLDAAKNYTADEIILINGGASGADSISSDLGLEFGWAVHTVRAEWHSYGKAAGPKRNGEMLNMKPHVILAFHDDLRKSKGTKNMVEQALKSNKAVTLFDSKGRDTILSSLLYFRAMLEGGQVQL